MTELLKFWTEKIIEIDSMEREKPSLGLLLETTPKVISVPRSNKRVELKMGNGNGMMTTNLGTVWKLLRPSWCPNPHASLIEEATERVRLAPTKDEDLGTLNVIHKLILTQSKESGEATSKLGSVKKLKPGSCLDLNRELKVKGLSNQARKLKEQREWMRSFEQLKAWEEIVISSDDEEALLRQITGSNSSGPITSNARNTK